MVELADSAAGVVPEGFFAVPFQNWNVADAWPGFIPDLAPNRIDPANLNANYNLACAAALRGDRDAAFRSLDRLYALGYRDAKALCDDADLASLRKDPRFGPLLARMGGEATK